MHHLVEQSEPETRQDIPTQGHKPGIGCMSFLSLGKEVFQAQGPYLCAEW